jgi:AcrR family transcriptional regulator
MDKQRAGTKRCRSVSGDVTRQRIIDALLVLLENKPLWEISIADITRQVGVSSQLFYAHFKNIEMVLLAHQDVVMADKPDLVAMIDGEWTGAAGLKRAREIVEAVLAFWNKHRIAMRTITMLCDQGRPDFKPFRSKRGNAAAKAFAEQMQARHPQRSKVEVNLAGWMLVAQLHTLGETYPQVLASPATHREIVDTAARFVQRIVVS